MFWVSTVLAVDLQEGLGMMFGGGVIAWALWCLYQWGIKPDRETRRHLAEKRTEEMHRIHWQRVARPGAHAKPRR
jgi:hypothetical protein